MPIIKFFDVFNFDVSDITFSFIDQSSEGEKIAVVTIYLKIIQTIYKYILNYN